MDGKEETQVISARVRAPVANRMRVLLMTKGYEEAERQLTDLNTTFATEVWWPPVYSEMVQLITDYYVQKQREMDERWHLQMRQQLLLKEEQGSRLLGGVHITNMMSGGSKEETNVNGNMYNVKDNKEVNLNGKYD